MDLPKAFVDRARHGVRLAELTRFRLGGPARYMVSPQRIAELVELVRWAHDACVELRVLGGGANVLIADDGVDGLVVRLDAPAFTRIRYDGERVHVGAGVDLMTLARDCAHRGLSGLECMAGIPGTVGGAVAMNAGGQFGQLGDAVESVEMVDRSGSVLDVPAGEMAFGYRSSAVGDRVVTGVVFGLALQARAETLDRFNAIWRAKKTSQPMADHSAGCVFKNPKGDSAGRLIDEAGLKGVSCGGARVSDRHANFIVADAGATTADVLRLVELIRGSVRRRTGTELELEIDIW